MTQSRYREIFSSSGYYESEVVSLKWLPATSVLDPLWYSPAKGDDAFPAQDEQNSDSDFQKADTVTS